MGTVPKLVCKGKLFYTKRVISYLLCRTHRVIRAMRARNPYGFPYSFSIISLHRNFVVGVFLLL